MQLSILNTKINIGYKTVCYYNIIFFLKKKKYLDMYEKDWKNVYQNEKSGCMVGEFENMNNLFTLCFAVCLLLEFSRNGLYNQKKNDI